jgi:hypothetical protein
MPLSLELDPWHIAYHHVDYHEPECMVAFSKRERFVSLVLAMQDHPDISCWRRDIARSVVYGSS